MKERRRTALKEMRLTWTDKEYEFLRKMKDKKQLPWEEFIYWSVTNAFIGGKK